MSDLADALEAYEHAIAMGAPSIVQAEAFGVEGGYRTQLAAVLGARTRGWVERREVRYGTGPTVTHYCPICKDKP